MRVHLLIAFVAPLACFGCKERGQHIDDPMTEQPSSGGFTSDDNSAAFQPSDEDSPSAKPPPPLPSPKTQARAPAPKKRPPPPPPQPDVPTPHGRAGGTLSH